MQPLDLDMAIRLQNRWVFTCYYIKSTVFKWAKKKESPGRKHIGRRQWNMRRITIFLPIFYWLKHKPQAHIFVANEKNSLISSAFLLLLYIRCDALWLITHSYLQWSMVFHHLVTSYARFVGSFWCGLLVFVLIYRLHTCPNTNHTPTISAYNFVVIT